MVGAEMRNCERWKSLLSLGFLLAGVPAAAQDFDYRQVVEEAVASIEHANGKRLMIDWGEEPRQGWLDVRKTRQRSHGLLGCVTLQGRFENSNPIFFIYVIDADGKTTGNPYMGNQLAKFLPRGSGISHDPGCAL